MENENKNDVINIKLLFFIYGALLATVFLYIFFVKPFWTNPSGDFLSNLIGAKLLLENPTNLYSLESQRNTYDSFRTQQIFIPFRDLPTSAVPYATVAGFSKVINALRGWYFINIVMLALAGLMFTKNIKKAGAFIFFSILFYPILDNFWLGQTGILLLFIAALFQFLVDKKRFYLAGAVLALLIIKPTFLVLVIFLIATLKDKTEIKNVLMGFGITLAILFFLIALVFQNSSVVSDNLEFIKTLRIQGYREEMKNQFSIGAILREHFNMQGYKALFFNAILFSAGLIFVTYLKEEFKNSHVYRMILIVVGVISCINVFPHALAVIYPYLFNVIATAIEENNKKQVIYGIMLYMAPIVAVGLVGRIFVTNPIINIIILLAPTYLIADS